APSFFRNRYVGIDNVAAGRTAASLIGRFLRGCSGKIALVAGSMLVRDHVERRMGFDQVISSEYPNLQALPVVEGRDDRDATLSAVTALLAREPDIVGLYNIGAGNLGLIEALSARSEAARPVVVAHELSDHTRAALETGLFQAVINQDAGHEARSAIRTLRSLADQATLIEAQEHIRIEIYLRDNLP
ncbi:substrate-binding domain-containing protein, partial [Escherichia coli]|nr:substrate-binding domain-containing protein [Escherichia coli]